jgi:membrane associated rhomboid family serine protease
VYATHEQAAQHGLVVLALGHPYWLLESPGGFRLLVEPAVALAARAQLAAFDRESLRWPPPPIRDPWIGTKVDLLTPLLWTLTVLAFFQASAHFPAWIDRGALDSQAVFERGQWWRVVTPLFLHANAAHVISNALSGLLVFSAVVSTLGRMRGWLLVALASALGNTAVAAVNFPGPYTSIGASTAIFAGVGLLAGRAIRIAWQSSHPHRWRAMFAPFAAGATVLALYGAGGQRVDVGAHLTGFVAGLVFGFIAGMRRPDVR